VENREPNGGDAEFAIGDLPQMGAESAALLEQIDRKNRMFGQLSQFIGQMQASEASTEQWKTKLTEHDAAKTKVALLEKQLQEQTQHVVSLTADKAELSEGLKSMGNDVESFKSKLVEDRKQSDEKASVDGVRLDALNEQLAASAQRLQNSEKDIGLLREEAIIASSAKAELVLRCDNAEKKLAAANAMIQKLETIGVDEMKHLKKTNDELVGKLSESRETLAESERKRQEAQNANSSMLYQLKVKAEKGKDLLSRCERMEQEHKQTILGMQRTVDQGRAQLMQEQADAMAAKEAHNTVVESLLANLTEKLESLSLKENEMRAVEAQRAATANDNIALQAELAGLKEDLLASRKEAESRLHKDDVSKTVEASSQLLEQRQTTINTLAEELKDTTKKFEDSQSWKAKVQGHLVELCTQLEVPDVSALTTKVLANKGQLEAQGTQLTSLQEENDLLSECIEDMEGERDLLKAQKEHEQLQGEKRATVDEGRRKDLTRSLEESLGRILELETQVEELRNSTLELEQQSQHATSKATALEMECQKTGTSLSEATVLLQKLEGLETNSKLQQEEGRTLKKANMHLTESLALARESLAESERKRQESQNASSSILSQLEIKTEKNKDLAEGRDKMRQEHKEALQDLQRTLDATREDLMRERAEKMVAVQMSFKDNESKDGELTALKGKVTHLLQIEHDFRVLKATHTTAENEKSALKSEIALLKKEMSLLRKESEDNEVEIARLLPIEKSHEEAVQLLEQRAEEIQRLSGELQTLVDTSEGLSTWKVKVQGHLVELCKQMEVPDMSSLSSVVLQNKHMLEETETAAKELEHQLEDTVLRAESRESEMQITIEQLEQEVTTTNITLQNVQKQIASQQLLVEEVQSKHATLENSKDRSQNELAEQLAAAIKESKSQTQHLHSQITKHRERIGRVEGEKLELLEEAEQLNQKLVAQTKATAEAEGQMSRAFSELQTSQQDLVSAEDKICSQMESLKQLNATLLGYERAQMTLVSKESMDEMEQILSAEKVHLENECHALRTRNKEMETTLSTVNREKKNAEVVASTKRSQLQDAAEMMSTLKSESHNLNRSQTQAIQALEESLLHANQDIARAKQEIEELSCSLKASMKLEKQLQDDLESLRRSKRDLNEQLRTIEKTHAKLNVDFEHSKTSKETAWEVTRVAKDEAAALSKENEKLSKQLSELRRKEGMLASDLRKELAELQRVKSTIESALAESESQAGDHESVLQRMQTSTNITVNGLMEQIQTSEREYEADRESYQKDIQTLKDQLVSIEKDLEHVKKSSKNTIFALRKDGEDLRNDMDRMKSEMRTSTAILEAKRRDAEALTSSKEGQLVESARKLRLAQDEKERAVKETADIRAKFDVDIRTQFEQEQMVNDEISRLRTQNNKLSKELSVQYANGDSKKFQAELKESNKNIAHLQASEKLATTQLAKCEKEMEELRSVHLKEMSELNAHISRLCGELEASKFNFEHREGNGGRPPSASPPPAPSVVSRRDICSPVQFSKDKRSRAVSPLQNPFKKEKPQNMELNNLVMGNDTSAIYQMDVQQQQRQLAKMRLWNEACEGANDHQEDRKNLVSPVKIKRQSTPLSARSELLDDEAGVNSANSEQQSVGEEGYAEENNTTHTEDDPWEQMLQRGPVQGEYDDGGMDTNTRGLSTSKSVPAGIEMEIMVDGPVMRSSSADLGEDAASSARSNTQRRSHSRGKVPHKYRSEQRDVDHDPLPKKSSPYVGVASTSKVKKKKLQNIVQGRRQSNGNVALPKI
jgi:chromosome segregation ATPase